MKYFWKLHKLVFFIMLLSLYGCASSQVSREANDNTVVGYQNATSSFGSLGDGSFADSYENASQSLRGAAIGGTAGALAGGVIPGVGLVPGLASGAILGGAYGAYIDSRTSLNDQLENRGVKIIELGDNIMVVMHSNRVFNGMTAVIRPGAYTTLNLVGKYINGFRTMSVRVAAYTNSVGSDRINKALSKEQAESIVRYLWQQRINTRMITAAGMGGTNLVSSDTADWDAGMNYRIEITMVKMPIS